MSTVAKKNVARLIRDLWFLCRFARLPKTVVQRTGCAVSAQSVVVVRLGASGRCRVLIGEKALGPSGGCLRAPAAAVAATLRVGPHGMASARQLGLHGMDLARGSFFVVVCLLA